MHPRGSRLGLLLLLTSLSPACAATTDGAPRSPACASAVVASTPPKPEAPGATPSADGKAGTGAAVSAIPPSMIDPRIVELAQNAELSCVDDDDTGLPTDCSSYYAWDEEQDLFASDKAFPTLLHLLEHPRERLRLLAVNKLKMLSIGITEFDTPTGRALVTIIKRERNPEVATELAWLLSSINLERIGMSGEVRALIEHPVVEFRREVAQTTWSYDDEVLVREALLKLLGDADPAVQEHALISLSSLLPTVPVCQLLRAHLQRTDHFAGVAQSAAAKSGCPGLKVEGFRAMLPLLGQGRDARFYERARGRFDDGYVDDARSMCADRRSPPALKRLGFDVLKSLLAAPATRLPTRVTAIHQLAACDPDAAKPVLTKLAKDPEARIAQAAQKQLDTFGASPRRR
ncbi:HEAT repeat domain-containing protein [Chondromyces crocatus]|uniref:PBS lyase n=1 Tax=Chondromyces crocatus TaxID=52 RepID=A0A0K1EHJ8_CHOCO|nr:HEAT repeat domain-containing protein [Chondromyces crocatus]AKT40147.1 uncharacterized protein CMC5_043000 [Chondromyces crocatus]